MYLCLETKPLLAMQEAGIGNAAETQARFYSWIK